MTKTAKAPDHVGVLIKLDVETHRKAKAACALAGVGWAEAITEALQQWTLRRMAAEGGRR
jgi:hypothetical protein